LRLSDGGSQKSQDRQIKVKRGRMMTSHKPLGRHPQEFLGFQGASQFPGGKKPRFDRRLKLNPSVAAFHSLRRPGSTCVPA
jgi:hypothetical protein